MNIRKVSALAVLFAAFLAFSPVNTVAKDPWLQVRSKNFFLIGDASEEDIRKVATKLEQFRESFRLLFNSGTPSSPVPTTVVVFKDKASYKPFTLRRADGKADKFVAGYFQPGEDVNYVTVTTEGTDEDTFGTIYHEYVHFVLDNAFGRSEVPPWFNEGLAEFYQTFAIEKDQNIKLGVFQHKHILLLRQNSLIPLNTFFNIDNRTLRQNGDHSKSIFYAQSWALVHYLTLTGKGSGLKKFLTLSMNNRPREQAFQEAFGIGYADMEKELRKYVGLGSFKYMYVPLKNKLVFDADLHVSLLDEADSSAYLGDLLYHTHRLEEAEPLLRNALTLKPDSGMANTTLGMVKIKQRKYDEAKGYLEKAIAQDQKNYLALYRYAYLISREGRDEFGFVSKFDAPTAARMREMLKRAISLRPAFTQSYELLAFVNLVNNEELDDALLHLQKALRLQPGNERYLIRIAEIYLRQSKFKEASAIADKLATSSDEDAIRFRAASLAKEITQQQQLIAYRAAKLNESEGARGSGERVLIRRQPGEEKPTAEQLAKSTELFKMRAINHALRPIKPGEKQIVGKIIKIDCKTGITYSIKTDTETLVLTSKDFQTLNIMTFVQDAGDKEVGCNSNVSTATAVLSYRPGTAAGGVSRGELVAIEFVPDNFRFIDLNAEAPPPTYEVEETGPGSAEGSFAEMRRKGMTDAIRERLRKPGDGERREMGFIERSECTSKAAFMHIRVGMQVMKLIYPQGLVMGAYTPDIEGILMGCGMKSLDVPVVFVFKTPDDAKAKTAGELVSLEFVPKSFSLN